MAQSGDDQDAVARSSPLVPAADASAAFENTSGMGKGAPVPPEIKKWNWGAFTFNWIWGLANSVYIALLCLIPLVGLVMAFVLGAKGNEWAWQKRRWLDVAAFKRTQRRWAIASLIYVALVVIAIVLVFVLDPETSEGELTRTLTSEDGNVEISVPSDWSDESGNLNEAAIIEAGDAFDETYVVVLDDSKKNFADKPSLPEFSKAAQSQFVASLGSARVTKGPDRLLINGTLAYQYEIRGTVDNINVVYLHTSLEAPTRYLQVIAWTLRSNYGEYRALLRDVTASIKAPL